TPRASIIVTPQTTTCPPLATIPPADPEYWRKLEKYLPTEAELPDRVAFQATFDLSNEKAANDPTEIDKFMREGRISGVQGIYRVDGGTRTISLGVSFYGNCNSPKDLLRQTGEPANISAPGRFPVTDLGDEYIAQRGTLGSGEASASYINLVWVRGHFFISLV